MENSNPSPLRSDTVQKLSLFPTWQDFLQLVLIAILFFIGFLIELSPKWEESFIHISLSPGHGFTTQDAAALIPLGIAFFLIISAIRKYQPLIKQRIQEEPFKALAVTLVFSLSIGLLLGLGLGIIFKIPLVMLLKDVFKPVQMLFFG